MLGHTYWWGYCQLNKYSSLWGVSSLWFNTFFPKTCCKLVFSLCRNENWSWSIDSTCRYQIWFFLPWYVEIFVNSFVVSLPVSLRLPLLVWWTILTMRMRRRKMRRSSLQGSGPVWALKANRPLFGRGGRTLSPSHPPSGRLIGPWLASATCQSHWGDRQRWAPTSLSPSWSLLLFSPSVERDGELLFWKEWSVCSFSLSILLHFTNSLL